MFQGLLAGIVVIKLMWLNFFFIFLIEDCAKDGGEDLFRRSIAFELQIFNDSIGIRLKNAVHLGKNHLLLYQIH